MTMHGLMEAQKNLFDTKNSGIQGKCRLYLMGSSLICSQQLVQGAQRYSAHAQAR